jgi:hypothetical protein
MEFAVSGAPAPSIFSANCSRRHLGDKLFEKAKSMMRTYSGRFLKELSGGTLVTRDDVRRLIICPGVRLTVLSFSSGDAG